MASAFLLFFPACIVMFRRVERRLDAIIQEMNLRSDLGTVFLPYEFSPAAADGARSQVEMQVVEARAFLGRLKCAAAAQVRRCTLGAPHALTDCPRSPAGAGGLGVEGLASCFSSRCSSRILELLPLAAARQILALANSRGS